MKRRRREQSRVGRVTDTVFSQTVSTLYALECLLRPPRRCLLCCALPLRKNWQRGADLLAGTTTRSGHRPDRHLQFAQEVCGIFERVYRLERFRL